MKTRKFIPSDYETLCKWWKDNDWFVVPTLEILSTDGYITLDEKEQPIACCFMYYASNAPFAFLGLPVTDKNASDTLKIKGLITSLEFAISDAKSRGVKLVTSYTEHPTIVKILQKKDFSILEEKSTVLGLANFDISCIKQDQFLPDSIKGNI